MVIKKVRQIETIEEKKIQDKDKKVSPSGKEIKSKPSLLVAGFETYEKYKHKVK